MLASKFNALRERLDGLKAGASPHLGLLDRARGLFSRDDGVVELVDLRALDRELDRAGVHTAADARLLRDLGQAKGRLGELSRGLGQRAETSLAEFELALREAERLAAAQGLEPGLLTQLEGDFSRLGRIVKTAAVFATTGQQPFEIFAAGARESGSAAPVSARVAIAEFLAQRAQGNVSDTAQKRRDLDLAHELLLRMSAEARGDRDRVRHLRLEVSAARDRVRSSPAVRSLDDLVRHLRHSARRDPRTAFKSLRALYDRAVEAGDAQLAEVAGNAVGAFLPGPEEVGKLVEQADVRRLLGWREQMRPEAAEKLPPGGKAGVEDQVDDVLAKLAFDLDENRLRALELAAGAARFFDIEDSLTEDIVEAETTWTRPIQRRVPYPTQQMTYEFTNSLDELNNFVVSHPRTVILDLASNRQPVRSYIEEQLPPKPKKMKKTAVRVYVLDASGSMHGARARFRDAILIAELNAMRVKARVGTPFDPLYFSFFNDRPTDLTRVDSGAEATRQIEKLFRASPAEGQTDITLALMAAFESISKAIGTDPYLSRATVVLVTDGEDGVDLELIRKTKRPFEGLDIALSFISLGEENSDLKSLVLEQRAQGARAFYHHLTDAEINLARTEFDSAWRTLLPADVPPTADALERLLPFLEALDAIAQGRPAAQPVRAELQFDAQFPVAPQRGQASAQLSARLADILEAIAEAASLAPADTRASEAVVLLNHLLGVYAVTLPRYLEAVGAAEPTKKALARVRLICRPFD